MVIFGGWHPIYYEALQRIRGEGIPSAFFWTSSVGQTDFSNGGVEITFLQIISDLIRSDLLDYVILGTPQNLSMFQQFTPAEKTIYLPYAFDWDDVQKHKNEDLETGEDWVDLFCPADTRKNILVQAHGAKLANVRLHYSGLRPFYKYFSDLIDLRYTDMGWMPKENYYKVVQTMKLGLQVTYAETFDYVVAEHFAMERPCLISTVMGTWVESSLWDELMVYNVDDPFEVRDHIQKIVFDYTENEWKDLGKRCFDFMKKESESRNAFAQKVLEKLIKKED